jgi:hypothetical protein
MVPALHQTGGIKIIVLFHLAGICIYPREVHLGKTGVIPLDAS